MIGISESLAAVSAQLHACCHPFRSRYSVYCHAVDAWELLVEAQVIWLKTRVLRRSPGLASPCAHLLLAAPTSTAPTVICCAAE